MIWLNRKALAKAWGALLMVCLGAGAAAAQGPQLPPDPNDLVRQVVANETKRSVANWHFTWRDTRQKGGITEARQLVETRDGMIARLIALNGKPLSPEQSLKEDHRLQRLLNNPDELAKKKRQQKEDEDRVTRMVKALPDAFLFHYAGTEESPEGTLVKMTFEPNPAFAPSSRELQVYEGMKGALVVNLGGLRLAAIDARLFRDVNFGWGILGHLDEGGAFAVRQQRVGNDEWEITSMDLNFTGKILMLKSLKIQQHETGSDFRRVPGDLTLAQGIDMLKRVEAAFAESQATAGREARSAGSDQH